MMSIMNHNYKNQHGSYRYKTPQPAPLTEFSAKFFVR